MKIRIKGNQLRFRLRQYDVNSLNNDGMVVETIEFGENENEQIGFALSCSEQNEMSIEYKKNVATVHIPQKKVDEWINTEQVGIEAHLNTGRNKIISVLIEKDFACIDANEEDNEGTYPNPLTKCEV